MPNKGSSRKYARDCLVCGGQTNVARMSIDLCRACAIFYRRRASRRPMNCRSNTDRCPTGRGLNCKKCRFDWIERLANRKPEAEQSPMASSAGTNTCRNIEIPRLPENSYVPNQPLLERLSVQYRSMCHTRLLAEVHARGNAPHPLRLSIDDPPICPANYQSMQVGGQILLTSLLEFGCAVFPEFDEFDEREKWAIVTEFFYRFRSFEGCHRSNKFLPNHPTRCLVNFTTFVGPEVFMSFFAELPPNADIQGSADYISNSRLRRTETETGRKIIARFNPDHEEFMAVLGLMFWSIDRLEVRPEISALAQTNTNRILNELHAHYRDVRRLDDYATRLGELLMFIHLFDVKEKRMEHYEMLRLLNIFDDETFIYRLQKE